MLEPFAKDQAETPLILVTAASDDETLRVLEVNVGRGVLPWIAVRADPAELAALAAATGCRLVAAGQQPRIRHVGRATQVTVGPDGVTITGSHGKVHVPARG